ncbi:MAG: outer membrane protein assembly factor BamB family protein [Caulobacteraceae bacterium]
MTSRRGARLGMLMVFALALTGCGTLNSLAERTKLKSSKNKVVATRGERIPLVAADQKLAPAEGLQGQTFYLPDPEAAPAWPQPQGTPNAWVANPAVAAGFQVAWKRDLGQKSGRKEHVTASPVVADGKVFAMDGDARVSAHDAATGAKLWSVGLQMKTKRDKYAWGGGVTYDGGRLYVTSGYRFVAALDATTGAIVWRTQTSAPVHGAPAVGHGRVFAVDIDNQLVSFDTQTGAADWTYQALSEPARLLKASAPAIADDAVITAFSSGELSAFRASNGAPLWSQTLSRATRNTALSEIRDIAGRPVIYSGEVYAGSHSGVFMSLDQRTGSPRWTLPAASISTPWPAGDAVFLVSRAGEVICAARASGQIYWINDLNKGIKKRKDRAIYYGPVLASGRLVVISSKGYALALNPQTGAETGRIKIGGSATMSPIPAGNMLYLVTDDAELVAIQ